MALARLMGMPVVKDMTRQVATARISSIYLNTSFNDLVSTPSIDYALTTRS